jgi:hypothetical protein
MMTTLFMFWQRIHNYKASNFNKGTGFVSNKDNANYDVVTVRSFGMKFIAAFCRMKLLKQG